MNPSITKELLFDHFHGNVSARQRLLIDEWARQPENEEFFYKCLMEWEISRPQYQVDVQHAIGKFRGRHQHAPDESAKDLNDVKIWSHKSRRIWYAAACVVLLLSSFGWIFQREILYQNLATRAGEVRSWTLADGSKVSLNANSELTVPRWGFGTHNREVFLKGEAEFEVTHKADGQRFVVKTSDGLDVVVLGTEFTVYSRTDKTQVLLNKGKVRIQHQNGAKREELVMAPGEMVTVKRQGFMEKNRFEEPEQFAAWKESRFVFNKTTLTEIARLLETNYNLKVEISQPEIAGLTVSGSFKALDHHELINSISQILDIRYQVRGKRVIFSQDTKAPQ